MMNMRDLFAVSIGINRNKTKLNNGEKSILKISIDVPGSSQASHWMAFFI